MNISDEGSVVGTVLANWKAYTGCPRRNV